MKPLLVYYSHSGNNRLLAEHLAQRLACDVCPIVETKRRTWLTILLDLMFQRAPRIEPPARTPADYDRTILVAPVWGSQVAAPMKSFIKSEKSALTQYSFITLCGYEQPEQKDKLTAELTKLVGHSPRAVAELRICDLFPAEKRREVRTINSYRVTNDDLSFWAMQIEEFLVDMRRAEPSAVAETAGAGK